MPPLRDSDRPLETPSSVPPQNAHPALLKMSPAVVACYHCPNAVNILPILAVQFDRAEGDVPPHVESGVSYWVLEIGWLIWGVEIWVPVED